MAIYITAKISLADDEIEETFVRSSGPGGQNVNKVSTAVQLRFDVENSPSLPEAVRQRLKTLAGKRLTRSGVLVLCAQNHRSQELNRQEALERLISLIQQASLAPIPRYATRPTYASKMRRLDAKQRLATVKRMRSSLPHDGD